MNKTKLSVFLLTFIFMIAITPYVFSKLMNSKFDSMVKEYEQKYKKYGLKVKEIENKSSYLTTDRVFEVSFNNYKDLKTAKFLVDVKFKNLPVTDVVFDIKPEKFDFDDATFSDNLNKFSRFIELVVITNNFKDFKYKLKDIKLDDFKLTGVNGIYFSSSNKFNLNADKLFSLLSNKESVEFKNLHLTTMFELNKILNIDVVSNVYMKSPKIDFQIDKMRYNVNIDYNSKLLNVLLKESFDKMLIANQVEIDKAEVKFNLKDFYIDNIQKFYNIVMQGNLNNVDDFNKMILLGVNRGFKLNIVSNIKDLKYLTLSKDIGYFNLDFKSKVTENNLTVIDDSLYKYVQADLKIKTTPTFAQILMNSNPQMMFLFALAKKEKDSVVIDLSLKNGKLYSGDKELK